MATSRKYQSLSARMWNGQHEIVRAAAKELHMTVPEYVRYRLVPQAAKDARRPLPDFPPFSGQGRPSPISEAAGRLGLSVGEFRRRMVDAAADAIVRAALQPAGTPASLVEELARSVSASASDRARAAELSGSEAPSGERERAPNGYGPTVPAREAEVVHRRRAR